MPNALDPRRVAEDATLKTLVKRAAAMTKLSALKAMANLVDPAGYPLPADTNCLERKLAARLASRPTASQQRAMQHAKKMLAATDAARKAVYGDLAAVDLKSAKSVASLATAALVPMTTVSASDLTSLASRLAAGSGDSGTTVMSATGTEKFTGVKVRLREVICHDETDPEGGDDEIVIGGITVDETGDLKVVDAFTVRDDFEAWKRKTYDPPQKFCAFNITEGDKWPKTYAASLILAEADLGGFPEFLSDGLKEVSNYLAGLLAGLIVGGATGNVLGAAIGALLGLFVGWLVDWWEDDIFPAITIATDISSRQHLFASGTKTSSEKSYYTTAHGGTYWVYLDWQMYV